MSWVTLTVLVVFGSCNWTPASGQTCSLSAGQFSLSTVNVSIESVDGPTPAVRVTWNTTVPPECVTSVRVEFRNNSRGPVVTTYTTTNTSQTEVIQTGLRCTTYYYITVVVTTGETSDGLRSTRSSRTVQVLVGDIPIPFGVRAEVTADNTSIRVSWQWFHRGVFMCIYLVRVRYQPEGGSLMRYTVGNTTTTSATLSNLQCNTEYTIRVEASGGQTQKTSISRMVSLPVRAPPTPTEVTAQFMNTSSVRVAWQWTSSGPVPNCFNTTTVIYHPEGGGESSLQLSDPAATEATLTDLQCNTNYTVTVVATAGEHRRESEARTVLALLEDVPTPVGVRAEVTADNTSIRVSWQWSRQWLLTCVDLVRVHYQPEGGSLMMYTVSNTTATSTNLPNLQCDTKYTIWVYASGGQTGRRSVSRMASVPARGLRSLSAAVLSPTSVRLTWVAPCHTQQYHIYYRGTCGAYVDEGRLDTRHQEYTVEGLQKGMNYTFTVNQSGFSGGRVLSTSPVYSRTFTAVPSEAPQILEVVFIQLTEVSLNWREVPCVQQNGPITGYVVRYYATCGVDRDVQRSQSVLTTGSTIDRLTPITEYAFQVAAVNVNGSGPFSELIALGGAPRLVTVTAVNSTSVVVSWSEVHCFIGSGAVTHYLVQYHSSCCGGGTVQNVTTDGLVQVISGLTPNTVYTFRVAAVGAGQNIGPFSNPTNTSLPDIPHISCEASTQSTSAWAAVAVIAVVALLVLMGGSAVIWYQQRSIARMKSQPQSVYSAAVPQSSEQAKTAEIPLKECSAYGQVDQGGAEREEPHIYELP